MVNARKICLFLTTKFPIIKLFVIQTLSWLSHTHFSTSKVKYKKLQGDVWETMPSAQNRKTNTGKASKSKDYRKTVKTEGKRVPSPGGEWHTCNTCDLTGFLCVTESNRASEQLIPDWVYGTRQQLLPKAFWVFNDSHVDNIQCMLIVLLSWKEEGQ